MPSLAAFAKSTRSRYCGKFGLKPEVTPVRRGSSVQLRHEVLGNLIQLGERTGGLILQTKLEAARVTESRNRRRQEELDVRILDMGDTIGVHAHQLRLLSAPVDPKGLG